MSKKRGCGCMDAENCGCSYAEEVVYPEVTVYQSAEQIPSFSNIVHKAESKFDKLSDKIAKQYEKKGMSPKKAKEIGNKTAYTIGRKKYGKAGMARKSRAGRRAESFGAELVGGPCEICGEDLFRDYDDSMGDVCLSCYYKERSKQDDEGSEYDGWLLNFAESFEADDCEGCGLPDDGTCDCTIDLEYCTTCDEDVGSKNLRKCNCGGAVCKDCNYCAMCGNNLDAESFEAPKKNLYRDYPEWLTVKERENFHKVMNNIGSLMDRIEESDLYKVKTYEEAKKWLEDYWLETLTDRAYLASVLRNTGRDESGKHGKYILFYEPPYARVIWKHAKAWNNQSLDAESFEAQGNPDKRTTTQYATFYVGWEDEEGELRGGGKFRKYDDALAQAKIVSDRNGNSRIVSTRGFALWTDDGKGMWQEGYDKAEAKKFYSAEEDITIAQGWRLGLGMGFGLMTLSALTTLVALGLTKRDEGQE